MTEWIIEIQESHIRKKRCEASRFRKECDDYASELEEEKKMRHSSEEEIASLRAALDRAKEQALKEF